MSAHNKTPYITPSMEFSSGEGVVRGRRMQQLTFTLVVTERTGWLRYLRLIDCARRDQGISFFLANMTWLQPPGHVHTMIKDSWADITLGFTHAGGALPGNLTFTAQQGDKGLVLRAVNKGRAPLALTVRMEAGACLLPGDSQACNGGAEASVSTLSGNDLQGDNSPSAVDAIAPKSSKVALVNGAATMPPTLPIFFPDFRSYEVVSLHMCVRPCMHRKTVKMLPKLTERCEMLYFTVLRYMKWCMKCCGAGKSLSLTLPGYSFTVVTVA